jgi:hypothetical protein
MSVLLEMAKIIALSDESVSTEEEQLTRDCPDRMTSFSADVLA